MIINMNIKQNNNFNNIDKVIIITNDDIKLAFLKVVNK